MHNYIGSVPARENGQIVKLRKLTTRKVGQLIKESHR